MGKKKQSNRVIILDYRKEVSHTEIDIDLLDEQFPGYSDDDDNYPEIVRANDSTYSWSGQQEVIRIDLMEKTIAELKKAGCTHMEVMHHGDHNGYYIYGVHVSNADQQTIKTIRANQEKSRATILAERKAELEKELSEINREMRT